MTREQFSLWSACRKQALHSLRLWSRKNLSKAKLYLSPRPEFTGVSSSFENSRYVFFGVPYDRSSTYRAGSRFGPGAIRDVDRKSTRLNSSHTVISYAVFCLKKKNSTR